MTGHARRPSDALVVCFGMIAITLSSASLAAVGLSMGATLPLSSASDLSQVGGMPGGNAFLTTNNAGCKTNQCLGLGGGSYMCKDPGQQLVVGVNTYTRQAFLSCSPEYSWNTPGCPGNPTNTAGTCATSTNIYVDP